MKSSICRQEKRPVLHIPLSTVEILLEMIALASVVFIMLTAIQSWPTLPAIIPTHFGASGRPDGWGGKGNFLLLPILSIILIYVPMTFLSRYPHIYNYLWPISEKNAKAQYYTARLMINWLKTEIVCLFAFIHWKTIQLAIGKADGLGNWFLPFTLVVIFGTLGIYTYKSYQAR